MLVLVRCHVRANFRSALINLAAAGEVTANTLLADVEAEEIVRVVGSNVTGSLLGCRWGQSSYK